MIKTKKILKKIFNFLIMIIIITIIITTVNVSLADDYEEDNNELNETAINEIKDESEKEETIETSNQNKNNISTSLPEVNSRKYIVYDRNTGLSIYGKNETKQTPMASTTKIMTAIVVLENCNDLTQIVTVDKKSAGTGGSRLGLKEGDRISVNDLLYGLLLKSGNDAAMTLATYIAGSKENFANLMNKEAETLKLKNTHFVTPHGLDDPHHYTTAFELAKITDYALKNNKFSEIVNTKNTTIYINNNQKQIENTNELLGTIDGVYGVKTGFTNGAGRCLVTAIKRNDMDLIIVVLGADTRKDRAKDTMKLVKYVSNNYKKTNILNNIKEEFEIWKSINEKRIYINKTSEKIDLKLEEIPIKEVITKKEIKIEITALTYLEAPIEENTRIGTLVVKQDNNIIEEIGIINTKKINKNNIFDYFCLFAKTIKV